MISGRDQRAIDDPRDAAVARRWVDECGEYRHERRDDPVGCGQRYRCAGSELAEREVGAQCDARDEHAAMKGARPWSPSPAAKRIAADTGNDRVELSSGHRRENEQA